MERIESMIVRHPWFSTFVVFVLPFCIVGTIERGV